MNRHTHVDPHTKSHAYILKYTHTNKDTHSGTHAVKHKHTEWQTDTWTHTCTFTYIDKCMLTQIHTQMHTERHSKTYTRVIRYLNSQSLNLYLFCHITLDH